MVEGGDEFFGVFQVCHWEPFIAGVGPAFELDKVGEVALPELGVEDAFCFVFLISVNDVWPRAGVVGLFGDIIGGIVADVGD